MPFPDPQPGRYTSISVADDHACALTEDGEAVCWGGNEVGQAEVPAGRYTAISAGWAHTCAVTTAGEILCWGRGMGEQPPPGRHIAVSTSGRHACALTEDGEAVCWGDQRDWNDFGQTDAPPGRYVAISVGSRPGEGAHPTNSCALTEDGAAVCWGYGMGERPYDRVPGGDSATRFAGPYADLVSASGRGFCAVTVDGASECWSGWSLPDAALTPFEETLPPGTSLPGGATARYTAIAASSSHVCALTTAGQAVCGQDQQWQWLGGVVAVMRPPDPGPHRYIAIGVGWGNGCALTDTGEAVCWDAVDNKLAPPDPPFGRYVAVSDGPGHTCALTEDGEAACWGWNNHGQAEAPAGRYTAISAGAFHTCAI